MKNLLVRCGIIFLWVALITGLLYLPRWYQNSPNSHVINVFAWGDLFDPNLIAAFEKETGIQVNLNYYSSNEELLVKLKATGGEGYDLIAPSDYAVNLLIQENLLQPIDRRSLPFFKEIAPYLLGHFFDPHNDYSVPFAWELFGLGIDKNTPLDRQKPSWGMLFENYGYKVAMINDPISAVEMAAFYLFGNKDALTPEETTAVKNLLIHQKKWVEAYADARADYFLATKNCSVAVASSSYIWRSMRLFDFIRFVIPEEGTFITIENLCIPKASAKKELTYRFINYLYSKQSMQSHFETFGFFPATFHAETEGLDPQTREMLRTAENNFSSYHFFRNIIPQQEVRDLLVEVKTSDW